MQIKRPRSVCAEAEKGTAQDFSKLLSLSECSPWVPFFLEGWYSMQGEEEEISWFDGCSWFQPCFWLNQFCPQAWLSLWPQKHFKGLGKSRNRGETGNFWQLKNGVFSQTSHRGILRASPDSGPGLPHHHKVASSGQMAQLLSCRRTIHTWAVTLSTLIKVGLLTLNCSCIWNSVLSWGGEAG